MGGCNEKTVSEGLLERHHTGLRTFRRFFSVFGADHQRPQPRRRPIQWRRPADTNASAPSLPSTTAPAFTRSSPFRRVTAFGQTLKDKGIYLQLGYNEIILANVAGGKNAASCQPGNCSSARRSILRPCLASPGLHSILPLTNVMDTTSIELPEPRDRFSQTAVLHEQSACRSFSGSKASITTASISPPVAPIPPPTLRHPTSPASSSAALSARSQEAGTSATTA